MALEPASMETDLSRDRSGTSVTAGAESGRSAVAWSAVLAGALVAIATSIILIALGSGLGFAAASPWPGAAPAAETFAVTAAIWLIVTQWLSSALAGYMTGRLRTKWTSVHSHEVFFRDTAHGLLAWAVATVIVAGVALSTTMGVASTAGATTASYATDRLMRSTRPVGTAPTARAEVARLLSRGTEIQPDDRSYLTNMVVAQTGVSQQEAQQRVDTAIASIREAADKARKASSALGLFTALSMLIGAFIASVAAAYGGQLRDEHADLMDSSEDRRPAVSS
jgi:hypothetical protein